MLTKKKKIIITFLFIPFLSGCSNIKTLFERTPTAIEKQRIELEKLKEKKILDSKSLESKNLDNIIDYSKYKGQELIKFFNDNLSVNSQILDYNIKQEKDQKTSITLSGKYIIENNKIIIYQELVDSFLKQYQDDIMRDLISSNEKNKQNTYNLFNDLENKGIIIPDDSILIYRYVNKDNMIYEYHTPEYKYLKNIYNNIELPKEKNIFSNNKFPILSISNQQYILLESKLSDILNSGIELKKDKQLNLILFPLETQEYNLRSYYMNFSIINLKSEQIEAKNCVLNKVEFENEKELDIDNLKNKTFSEIINKKQPFELWNYKNEKINLKYKFNTDSGLITYEFEYTINLKQSMNKIAVSIN